MNPTEAMTPGEAMGAAIREIGDCKGPEISRFVARAVGAATAFARIDVMSEAEDLEWRSKARVAGIDQEHKTDPGSFIWDHTNVRSIEGPQCKRVWTLEELKALGVSYGPLMECPECDDIMTVRRVDAQKA